MFRPLSAAVLALGLFTSLAAAQQGNGNGNGNNNNNNTTTTTNNNNGPAELARVSGSAAASYASVMPCIWGDFVTSLELAAASGSYVFHESGGCDAWTGATLLEAFGGDAGALEAAGFGGGNGGAATAPPPRALALTALEGYRLRVAEVPSGAVLALSPTVTAVAVAPRAAGNQGAIVRAFRRFAALSRGDTVSAERSAGGRAFDAPVTFVPAPFPRVSPAGNATAAENNPFPEGKVVLFVAASAEAAAKARAASPSVARPSPLAAGVATPFLDALLASSSSSKNVVDPTVARGAAEEVITAWVGPWRPFQTPLSSSRSSSSSSLSSSSSSSLSP